MASGWARKKAGSFHTRAISSSRSSGVGAPVRVLIFCDGGGVGEQAVLLVVDELALLALLDGLDGEAELLSDLVVRDAVEVGDARVDVEDRVDGAESMYSRGFST